VVEQKEVRCLLDMDAVARSGRTSLIFIVSNWGILS